MSPTVEIAGRKIGDQHPPYIIAEISGNHLRCPKRARMIFEQAKLARVDALKIQTYTPESLAIEIPADQIEDYPQWKEAWGWNTGDIFNLYTQVHTPQGEFTDTLFSLGKEFGITVFSTPFGVEDAKALVTKYDPPAYKLGALEIDFFPLLEIISQTGKPIILNTAIASVEKIEATLTFLKTNHSGPVILLTGPKVYHEDSAKNFGLGRLDALAQRYASQYVIGLSDHFRGGSYNQQAYQGHEFSTAGIVLYGASVIEKHFCGIHSGLPSQAKNPDGSIDWAGSDIDGNASITTAEMQLMINFAQIAHRKRSGQSLSTQEEALLQTIVKMASYGYASKSLGPSQAEIDTNEAGATRFIYALKEMPQGHRITLADIHFSRAIHHAHPSWDPSTALPTALLPQLLGNTLTASVKRGDPIFSNQLQAPIDFQKPYTAGTYTL